MATMFNIPKSVNNIQTMKSVDVLNLAIKTLLTPSAMHEFHALN